MKISDITLKEYDLLKISLIDEMNVCETDIAFYSEILKECKADEADRVKRCEYMLNYAQERLDKLKRLLSDVSNAYLKHE